MAVLKYRDTSPWCLYDLLSELTTDLNIGVKNNPNVGVDVLLCTSGVARLQHTIVKESSVNIFFENIWIFVAHFVIS